MNISEAALNERMKRRKGPACTVGQFIASLDEANRADFLKAMADPTLGHVDIARALKRTKLGDFTAQTLSYHRNHDCQCDRG